MGNLSALLSAAVFISCVFGQVTLLGNTKCTSAPVYDANGAWPAWGLGHVGCWTTCPGRGAVAARGGQGAWDLAECRLLNRQLATQEPAWRLPRGPPFDVNNPPQCKNGLAAGAADCGGCAHGNRAYCGPVTGNPKLFPIESKFNDPRQPRFGYDYDLGACSRGQIGAIGMGRMEECDGARRFVGGFCRLEPKQRTFTGPGLPPIPGADPGSNWNVQGPVPVGGGPAPNWGPKPCPPGTVEYGKLPCPVRGTEAPRANRLCRQTAHEVLRDMNNGHYFVTQNDGDQQVEYDTGDNGYAFIRNVPMPAAIVAALPVGGRARGVNVAREAHYDDEMLYEEAWDNLGRAREEFEIAKQLLRRTRLKQEDRKYGQRTFNQM